LFKVKLQGISRRWADEEDIALSAFKSFCLGTQRGQFPQLQDRSNLWVLLVAIAEHKLAHQARHELAEKRGGGKVRGDSALACRRGVEGPEVNWLHSRTPEPSPEFAAQVGEEYRRLLDLLADAQLQKIAVWKMEGYSNKEIAGLIGRAVPTVERKLSQIRELWKQEMRP
jgi:DNA-directed RNA polymerase specialized sigma24 family protein